MLLEVLLVSLICGIFLSIRYFLACTRRQPSLPWSAITAMGWLFFGGGAILIFIPQDDPYTLEGFGELCMVVPIFCWWIALVIFLLTGKTRRQLSQQVKTSEPSAEGVWPPPPKKL